MKFNDFLFKVKNYFNQSDLRFLLKFSKLGELLSQESSPDAWSFFNTYFQASSWTRTWYNLLLEKSGCQAEFEQTKELMIGLKAHNLYNQENCELVSIRPHLADVLDILYKEEILNRENFELVVRNSKPHDLLCVLRYLQNSKILNQDNFGIVTNHSNLPDLHRSLFELEYEKFNIPENFAILAQHAKPCDLIPALKYLRENKILTSINRTAIAAHPKPLVLARGLLRLEQVEMPEHRNIVVAHPSPLDLVYALEKLRNATMLTPDNLAAVIAHNDPIDLAAALEFMSHSGALTPENRTVVAAYDKPSKLARVLPFMREAGHLNTENIEAMRNHTALLTDWAYDAIWQRIPEVLLNRANYEALLTAAEHANPQEELERIRNQITGPVENRAPNRERNRAPQRVAPVAGGIFNRAQNTHTASVHRSVSDSAVRLKQRYQDTLNLNEQVQAIETFINELPDTEKNQAAKRCIKRLIARRYDGFRDTSGVSNRELLALAYMAIHDDQHRTGSLEDAKALFVDGLYEIQRGYNLDEEGVDNGGNDVPICVAGTFNKIIEKLSRIHDDVDVRYITHEGACLKFLKLAQLHAKEYLKSKASPECASDYRVINDLLTQMKADGSLAPIWEAIKADVQAKLWEEFSEAYHANQTDKRFVDLIANGHELNAPELSEIETQLMACRGYHAYLDEQARLSLNQQSFFLSQENNSLWAHRHSSAKDQELFDKQHGPKS